jgi:hypothetical protein
MVRPAKRVRELEDQPFSIVVSSESFTWLALSNSRAVCCRLEKSVILRLDCAPDRDNAVTV